MDVDKDFYKSSLYGDSPLIQEVQHGNFDKALQMEKDGAHLARDFCGFTPLMIALLCLAPLEILKKFLVIGSKHKQDIDIRSKNGGIDALLIWENLVSLTKFLYFSALTSMKTSWQNHIDQMNRTVAHALFLPSIQKTQLKRQGLSNAAFLTMINFFHENGALFNQIDNFGFTAADLVRP